MHCLLHLLRGPPSLTPPVIARNVLTNMLLLRGVVENEKCQRPVSGIWVGPDELCSHNRQILQISSVKPSVITWGRECYDRCLTGSYGPPLLSQKSCLILSNCDGEANARIYCSVHPSLPSTLQWLQIVVPPFLTISLSDQPSLTRVDPLDGSFCLLMWICETTKKLRRIGLYNVSVLWKPRRYGNKTTLPFRIPSLVWNS